MSAVLSPTRPSRPDRPMSTTQTSPLTLEQKPSGTPQGALGVLPTPESLPASQSLLGRLSPGPTSPSLGLGLAHETNSPRVEPPQGLFSWDGPGSPARETDPFSADFEMDSLGSPTLGSATRDSATTRERMGAGSNSPPALQRLNLSLSAASTAFAPNARRPPRARYESPLDSPPSSASFVTAPLALDESSAPPSASLFGPGAKRPFELVSPSTGSTPPAVDFDQSIGPSAGGHHRAQRSFTPIEDDSGRDSPVGREAPPWRGSFEAQRATYSPAVTRARLIAPESTSTLRRRSPLPSRAASRDRSIVSPDPAERDDSVHVGGEQPMRTRSKRRRASTILPDHNSPAPTASSSSAIAGSSSLTQAFAPAQGPYVDQPPTSRIRGLPRLSLSASPLSASGAEMASPTSPSSPRSRRGSFSAFAGFRRHPSSASATSTSFQLASPVEVGRATGSSSSVALPADRRSATPPTTTLRPRSARARPDPMRERELDPLVAFWREEIRGEPSAANSASEVGSQVSQAANELGEFEVAMADAEDTLANAEGSLNRARTLLARLEPIDTAHRTRVRSPPLSPTMSVDEGPLSPGGGRVQHFLTNLRARRPRLARGSTVPTNAEAPSPEQHSSPEIAANPWSDVRSFGSANLGETSPPPPLTGPWLERFHVAPWTMPRSELDELPPLGASTSTSTGAEPANDTLWGQISSSVPAPSGALPSGLSRRMRGPTERANEAWRQGRAPPSAQPQTRAALPHEPMMDMVTRTPIGVGRRTVAMPAPPRVDASPTAIPRPESPSPRTRRSGRSMLISLNASDDEDEDEDAEQLFAELMMDRDEDDEERPLSHDRFSLDRQRASFVRRTDPRFAPFTNEAQREAEEEAPPTSAERSGAIRLPRLTRMAHSRVVTRPSTSAMFDWAQENPASPPSEDQPPAEGNRRSMARPPAPQVGWRPPVLPLMLPSGSQGHRHFFPHPLHTAGAADRRAASSPGEGQEHELDLEHDGDDEEDEESGRLSPPPRLPAFGFEATRYAHPMGSIRQQRETATHAGGESSSPTSTNAHASLATSLSAYGRPSSEQRAARRTSLADALAGLGNGSRGPEWETGPLGVLRRRRAAASANGEAREEGQAQRNETLAGLRMGQAQVRDLLGSEDGELDSAERGAGPGPSLQAREPTTAHGFLRARSPGRAGPGAGGAAEDGAPPRRRVGLGGILGRLNAAHHYTQRLFEDDFGAFFGRDAIALAPGNYVDDDDFDTSYEALIRLSERLGDVKPKGVSADKLDKLTRFKYKDWPAPLRLSNSPSSSALPAGEDEFVKDVRCAICLCDYEEADDILLSHCEHGSHEDCLKEWLKERGSCPVCRREQ